MTMQVALYARVSSEKQAQSQTIDSQIAALEKRIYTDGFTVLNDFKFIDNGYSGSHLVRPALEKLRDKVSAGEVDKIYIHSPDRLARKYAYQMLLLEEFQKSGVTIVFLNHEANNSPETHLLLQMQGMIAEYERAKIMERHRRGKIHAAQRGSVNVLATAPYGYRYIDKYSGNGQASLQIQEEQAQVVRQMFAWVGYERVSTSEVCRRLNKLNLHTPKGKSYWSRSVIWRILRNPAYKGQAAFGKTTIGKRLPRLKPLRNSCEQPKRNYSVYTVAEENWIYIPVPAIIDDDLFEATQAQLNENREMARAQVKGLKYLLQGLLTCQACHYAYYGKPANSKGKRRIYYRCIGSDSYRFGGKRICDNTQVRADVLETVVWEEIKGLLKNPERLIEEYQRRLSKSTKSPFEQKQIQLNNQKTKLERAITRLIDSYMQEYISKEEFEPRIKILKQQLKNIQQQQEKINDQEKLKADLKITINNLKSFCSQVESTLENIDWDTKRDIVRILIKRIEIGKEEIKVVFRVNNLFSNDMDKMKKLQHCRRSIGPYFGI